MIKLDRAVGIDLGTTNSEIAMVPPSERDILIYQDRFGRKTIPSSVAWDAEKGSLLVGRAARARRGKEPAPIESIKRSMGQTARVKLGDSEALPEEISAKILAELASAMRAFLQEKASEGVEMPVARAVITVPAYFDAPQIEATRKAGELAGLSVIGILQEPTAAAIYHSWKQKQKGSHFLVYDLGGGTFDVSILRCVAGEYQVLAIDGDNFLGGDDFDRRYAEHLRKQLVKLGYRLDLDVRGDSADRARFERLVNFAQEIKESLSTAETINFSRQDMLLDQAGEPVSYEAEIGRAEYEAVIVDLVDQTIACCERALLEAKKSANVGIAEIDNLILVGGSTRVPLVRRRVGEALASRCKNAEPLAEEVDTIVALGAAIHAAQLGGLTITEGASELAVSFSSPLVSPKPTLRLAGEISTPKGNAQSVAVVDGETRIAEGELANGKFKLDVTPPGEGDSELELEAFGAGGASLGREPFVVYRGEVRPRASALSRAAVIAKDVGIEVVRAGRRERRILLAKGSGLPTETKYTFYTADQSGTVVLRLLQGRMPIKTLAITVARELPIGSPVEVMLKCDDAMRIEARAVVAGQELWATIQATEQLDFDKTGAVEQLLAEAETVKQRAWGHSGEAYRREIDQLSAAIREVLQTDPAKLSALSARLRRLLDDLGGDAADPLEPPLATFEAELDSLRRIVYRSTGVLVGLDRDAWEDRIHRIEERAAEARAAIDASLWRRTFNEVQALYETAVQEEFSARRLDDPAYMQMRANSVSRWRTRVEQNLVDFVPSATEELRVPQNRERDRLLAVVRERVNDPLDKVERGEVPDVAEVRRILDQCGAELERVETAAERLPSLGLVTERGGGGGRA
jgi:molecular chaperone DnaK